MNVAAVLPPDRARDAALLDHVRREMAERRLGAFVRQAWPQVDPADFVQGWHVDAITEHLEAVANREVRRLAILIPPRHMKSTTVAVMFQPWCWAQDTGDEAFGVRPGTWLGAGTRFLNISYAHSLSVRDNVRSRRVIRSPWYQQRWGDRVVLTGDQDAKTRYENTRGGVRIATSVDGMATGEGADIITIDDPHNVMDAESETQREAVLQWWSEVMPTRLNDQKTGAFVIVMQRVHERDLAGYILARELGWDVLCLPARHERDHPTPVVSSIGFRDPRQEGELLWPEHLGEDEITRLETQLGSYAAAGQLQQRPAPREGGLFKRHWFEIVRAAPAGTRWCRHWDLAGTKKRADNNPAYTAGVLLGLAPDGTWYVRDVKRIQDEWPGVRRLIQQTAVLDGREVQISLPLDTGSSGKIVAHELIKMLVGFTAKADSETGDKVARASPVAAQAEAGNVKIVDGPWVEAFLAELEMFPAAAHKDQVDALSGAFSRLLMYAPQAVATDEIRGFY